MEITKIKVEKLKAENARLRLTQYLGDIPHFKLNEAVRFVPKFNKVESKCFFTYFEWIAHFQSWLRDKWVLLTDSAFVGRAQEMFSTIDVTCVKVYEYVKRAVLNVYKKVPKAYRQEFCNCRKASEQ